MEVKQQSNFKLLSKSDKKAFESIFKEYYCILREYANFYTRDYDLAEDMVQEVFLKIWQKRNVLNIDISIKSYLMKCVYNCCLQHLRKEVKNNNSNSQDFLLNEALLINKYNSEPGLFHIYELEINHIVQNTIKKLPKKTQKIFIMSRFQHMSHKKIAQHFNISEKTIEYHITTVLNLLRFYLHDFISIR